MLGAGADGMVGSALEFGGVGRLTVGVEDNCGYGGGGSWTRTVKTSPVTAKAAAAPTATPASPAPTSAPVEYRRPTAGGGAAGLLVEVTRGA
ncbi:hypothetical protein A5634_07580 [Mycobacterium asiaticum]|uniref:Uncharacterized protein n=1 Tax=Mycobacterium asiaticum TaxID=1790 RepID=A0A1A3NJ89_MYCAS|nr:hypothetical protein A5634_07580 [Mycobacterium asiaticum]